MRFDAEQRFDAEAEHLVALFTDPDFYATLTDLPKISTPVVLTHHRDEARVQITYRQRFTGDLPSAAQQFIDATKLSWVEEVTFDLATSTASTILRPDHYADRFTCSGTYTFRDLGQARSSRRLDGDLRIRVPLLGGRVEAAIVSGLKEHAAAERDLIEARLLAAGAIRATGRPGGKQGKSKKNGKSSKPDKKGPKTKTKAKAKAKAKG